MFSLISVIILISSQCWLTHSNPARYDQRQTGDVNVQIDLKDVKVIALVKSDLLDDYMNYDYAYDYADFTLKPVTKPTTKAPAVSLNNSESTTVIPSTKPIQANSTSNNSSELSSIIDDKISTSGISTATDVSPLETSTKILSSNITAENTSTQVLKDDLEDLPEKITTITSQGALESSIGNKRERVTKRCKGLDKTGRCLRRRLSFLPLAMKVAPELIRSVRKRIAV